MVKGIDSESVQYYNRTLGYNYLIFKINTLWNPMAKMDYIDQGKYIFFLIKFSDEGFVWRPLVY